MLSSGCPSAVSRWISNGNGSDAYSFSALPAGYRYNDGYFDFEGYYAGFWSSTEYDSVGAYDMCFDYNSGNASLSISYKYNGYSV